MKTKSKTILITILFLAISITVILLLYGRRFPKAASKQLFAMDTSVSITADQKHIGDYINLIKSLDKKLSAYDEQSEISRLNHDKILSVSDDTAELLKKASEFCRKYPEVDITAGALTELWNVNGQDPTVPKDSDIKTALKSVGIHNLLLNGNSAELKNNAKIDLGSCAKGYALDLLYDKIKNNNDNYAIVSFGSSSLLFGRKPDGSDFVTSILNPDDKSSEVLHFKTGEGFVSTSGGYERFFEADGKKYSHIMDLKTGYPVETDLTSVTIVSETDGMLTDFMSTCIFIGGTQKIGDYLNNDSFQVIAIDKDKNIYCSKSFKDKIEITDKNYRFKH